VSRQLCDVLEADLERVLPAALDGTGPAVTVRTGAAGPARTVPDEVAVVVQTSGSTGEPREVMLSAGALLAAAHASAERLGGTGSWLLALPVTHVAGLGVLVRSLVAGTTALRLPAGPFRPAPFAAAAATVPSPSYCSLVPTQLVRLLDDPAGSAALSVFDAVLVGGAGVPQGLAARARAAGARVVLTYGATETCGGVVYDGRPLTGVEVAIASHQGLVPGAGLVHVSGPVLAHGYLGRDDLDADAFTTYDARRWFVTSDVGRTGPDGRLEVLGRTDDTLVTGGVKIAPAAVEQALAAAPGVREALVVGIDDPHWGQALAVLVVPAAGADLRLENLRAHVRTRLGRVAAPQHMVVVEALPLLASGKPDRRAAAVLAAQSRTEVTGGDSR